jgi:hypothetical protein
MPFDGIESPQVTEALIAVRRLLKRGWCQEAGFRIHWTWLGWHREYCLNSAVRQHEPESDRGRMIVLLKLAIVDLGYDTTSISKLPGNWMLMAFNDDHTRSEVLAVVDRAIAISQGRVLR